MTDVFVFLIIAVVCLKSAQYGVWTVLQKNISGGIFIFLLSACVLVLDAYLLLFGGA